MNVSLPLDRLARGLAVLAAAALLADAAARAAAHHADLAGVRYISGIWMTLARSLNEGVFYPPLEADGYYAGTRYMPLLFAVVAAAQRLTGDYLVALKLVSIASVLGLLAAVYFGARQSGARRGDALVLAVLPLAFPQGLAALESPHADALAAALSVAGLVSLGRGRSVLPAAALFAAAVATKFSALAGPAAALAVLVRGDRRRALRFALAFGLLTAAELAAFQFGSDGRFLTNLRALGSGGMDAGSLRLGPVRLLTALGTTPIGAAAVVLGLAAGWRAAVAGRLGVWDWYLFAALGTTLLIYTSPGTDINHLLEPEVAAVLALARPLAAAAAGPRVLPVLLVRGAALAAILAAVPDRLDHWLGPPDADAIPASDLVAALPSGPRLLTEDPTPCVLLDQRPVVMDPFAYRLLTERGRVDPEGLAGRVERREFEALVLLGRVDRPGESLCPRFHFGPRVTDAMQANYRFDRRVGAYFLFVPARGTAGAGGPRG